MQRLNQFQVNPQKQDTMKRNSFSILLVLCIILSPVFLAAKESTGKKEQLAFYPVTMTGNGISTSLMKKILNKITGPLSGENFFIINPAQPGSNKITAGKCLDNQCIAELAGITPDGIVIIISVTSEKVKTDEKVVSRYMAADMEGTRYTIHVATADILNKKYDLVFKKTLSGSDRLLDEAGVMGRAIKKFYIKRKPAEVKTVNDEPAADDSEKVEFYTIPGTTFSISMLYPFGEFSNIAEYGIGAEAVLNGISPRLPYVAVDPGITVYWLSPGTDNIKSGYMILPEVTFGYNIRVSENFMLVPAAGAGYSFMFIDGTTSDGSGMDFYYNPALRAGIEAVYLLSPGYSLFTAASYRCLFESDTILQSANINLGIRMNF